MYNIPLCDLKKQYQSLREDMLSAFDQLCQESAFIKGPYVKEFEQAFCKAHQSPYGIGCSDGTSAISLALESLGVGVGDEVILPSHTFIATAEAILHVGATPIFADIKTNDYTIDPSDIEQKINLHTKAIIPVHIYGTPCDMDEIMALAKKHSLYVVEDCAQAHLAQYKGQYVGTFGDCGTFSFYPGKNLGAYGDAGFILCRNQEIETKLRRLVDHGRLGKYDHDILGYNRRLDALQAAILAVKMPHLESWTNRRREIAHYYNSELRRLGVKTIEHSDDKKPVYHVYNIEVANRHHVAASMLQAGIHTGIHYPEPVHKAPYFQPVDGLKVTEGVSSRIMSLPIYPEMTDDEVQYVMKELTSAILS